MGGREGWCIETEELESQDARMGVGRLQPYSVLRVGLDRTRFEGYWRRLSLSLKQSGDAKFEVISIGVELDPR
jgi:hypothetical protein